MKLIRNLSCSIFIVLSFLIIISGYFVFDYFKNSSQVNQNAVTFYKDQNEFIFKVENGATLNEVISDLYDKKFISDQLYFQVYVKINNFQNIQAGLYKIKPGADFEEIMDSLKTPFEKEIKISFQEGLRMDEIADKIASQIDTQTLNDGKSKFNKKDFLEILNNPSEKITHTILKIIPEGKSLEGFIFPDTYYFPEEATAEEMILKFLDNFESKLVLAKANFTGISELKLNDYEIITLASVVEKEGTGQVAENSQIANVFYNRLRGLNGPKKLQSDVVILYQLKDWKATIYQTDLENADYLYNSHVHEGLPPTPICNMGLNSLIASYHPSQNDDLFFIAGNDGKVYYAKNYDEHLLNISKYLNN